MERIVTISHEGRTAKLKVFSEGSQRNPRTLTNPPAISLNWRAFRARSSRGVTAKIDEELLDHFFYLNPAEPKTEVKSHCNCRSSLTLSTPTQISSIYV